MTATYLMAGVLFLLLVALVATMLALFGRLKGRAVAGFSAIQFEDANVVFGAEQKDYVPLPARFESDGRVICCWRVGLADRLRILFGGLVWHQALTFGQPLQPQLLSTQKPLRGVSMLSRAAAQAAIKGRAQGTLRSVPDDANGRAVPPTPAPATEIGKKQGADAPPGLSGPPGAA